MTVQHNGAHLSAHVSAHVQVLAHHALLLAIPAFFPAVAVVGVVIWVAVRDRRTHDSDERLREEQKTNASTAERNGDPE
jgi:cytochrome c-type biogenesis protein CcmH/NrfF